MRQETAALRDFSPAYVRSGSKAAETVAAMRPPMSALPPSRHQPTWEACPL